MANEKERNENPKEPKDKWDILQIVFAILTTFVAGFWGAFLYFGQKESTKIQIEINSKQQEISNKLSTLDRTISSVEAMGPYFEKILDPDPKKCKLAGYALYMLNKEDPDMVVSLLATADKPELREVLEDLGKKNSKIVIASLSRLLPREDTEGMNSPKSRIDQSVESTIASIQKQVGETTGEGWCYLGDYENQRWKKKTIEISDFMLPEPYATYSVIDDTYLRDSQPQPPNYALGSIIRVIRVGAEIKIQEVVVTPNNRYRWARITITRDPR